MLRSRRHTGTVDALWACAVVEQQLDNADRDVLGVRGRVRRHAQRVGEGGLHLHRLTVLQVGWVAKDVAQHVDAPPARHELQQPGLLVLRDVLDDDLEPTQLVAARELTPIERAQHPRPLPRGEGDGGR